MVSGHFSVRMEMCLAQPCQGLGFSVYGLGSCSGIQVPRVQTTALGFYRVVKRVRGLS